MIIVAILGKSGSGKSTLEKALENMGFNRMISYTTRNIRDGEVNHREYHFINRDQFNKLIDSDILIEHAEYNGNLYGAGKPIGNTKNVIVVEPNGLSKFKELYGNQVVSAYIKVPQNIIDERLDIRNNTPDIESRREADRVKFEGIEDKVDIVLDGTKQTSSLVVDILNEILNRGLH